MILMTWTLRQAPRADGLSSDMEMSSLFSHSTSTNTHSESESGLSSDNMHHLSSDSDGSQFAGLDILNSVVDFYELTTALHDEVTKACILNACPPPAHNPQIYLLNEWKLNHPHLFQCKLHVSFDVFAHILGKIQDHPAFESNPNSPQLPVSIQLAVFLNAAGHYGNAAMSQDIAEWAGVSVGTAYNCFKRVMTAILSLHQDFIHFNLANLRD